MNPQLSQQYPNLYGMIEWVDRICVHLEQVTKILPFNVALSPGVILRAAKLSPFELVLRVDFNLLPSIQLPLYLV